MCRKFGHEPKQGKGVVNTGDRQLVTRERDGIKSEKTNS